MATEKKPNNENQKLNPKHLEFAIEYSLDCNGTRAYRKVYNTKNDNTARANAATLLAKPSIRQTVDAEINRRLEGRRAELKAIWIHEVERIATARIEDFLDNDGFPDIAKIHANPGLISQFDNILSETFSDKSQSKNHHQKLKLHSKEKALEMLGKHTGMLRDEPVKVGVTIMFGKEEADL